MIERPRLREVGAMDPELTNSPIVEELDEDADALIQQAPEEPVCYYNGQSFRNDELVISGTTMLRCYRGVWVEAGPADPANP